MSLSFIQKVARADGFDAPNIVQEIQDQALEMAAQVADKEANEASSNDWAGWEPYNAAETTAQETAQAIRALKGGS